MAKIWQPGQKRETPEERKARIARNDVMMQQPYEVKVRMAELRIEDWARTCDDYGMDCHVSVGGLDSITLLALVRRVLGDSAKGVSVSSLEDKSIQAVHKEMGVIAVKPEKSKLQVIREFGFPIISKQISAKISRLQTPGDDSPIIKAYMTGDEGAWGGYKHNEKFKMPDRWVQLFGGLYGHFRPDLCCQCAPFKVSDQCCFWLKEKPLQRYSEEQKSWPFLGLMQSEGGRRQYTLRMHGCNYVGETTARSCPFNYFTHSELLRLAKDMKVHVPEIYGHIIQNPDGSYRTSGAKRTGCSMCGYGIHMDKRPHHFDQLYEQNPQEWEFWMYKVGWGEVLDYIGVGWRQEGRQMSLFGEIDRMMYEQQNKEVTQWAQS